MRLGKSSNDKRNLSNSISIAKPSECTSFAHEHAIIAYINTANKENGQHALEKKRRIHPLLPLARFPFLFPKQEGTLKERTVRRWDMAL
jgi:hypothetical protein